MKKCQGTYNYIFSTYSLAFLKEMRLLDPRSAKQEINGYISQDIWLKNSSDFCIQFREIINEEEFLASTPRTSPELIEPGFIENKNIFSQKNEDDGSIFNLTGLLMEDTAIAKKYVLDWEFPCQIFWSSPSSGALSHQLSYKKKFPFWAILLECKDLKHFSRMNTADVTQVEFQNKRALWVHLETTSWDFLIFAAES